MTDREPKNSTAALRPGFYVSELERLAGCLDRLMPHVRQGDVAITGGVAIQLRLAELGYAGRRAAFADLDCVASTLDAIGPGVADDFLVSHYHVVQPGVPKFMVQLVDRVSRVRVDVFPDLVGSLARARVVQIENHRVKMLALEDILEHKLRTISTASPTKPVDPKHADDAYLLGEVLGRRVSAVARECLVRDVYGSDDVDCERCRLSLDPMFPLAPKREIFSLLGWTLDHA
jgi:hypothetical protein